MATFLVTAIPVVLAIALALAFAVGCVLQYRLVAAVRPELRLVAVLLIVGLGALLSVALTTRELDDAKATGTVTFDDVAGGFAASRWFSLFLVVASLIEVARGWAEGRLRAAADPARPLLWTMLAYYLGTALVQAVASDVPDFSLRSIYLPVVLAAVCSQRPVDLAPVFGAARLVIVTLMIASLGGIWLKPDFVIHRPEPGLIPGIDWRLYGLTPHANAIGPIALLGLLVELHSPSFRKAMRWVTLVSCTAVLVLAQSKTTWIAMPLMLLFVWLPLRLARAAAGADTAARFRRTVLTLSGVIVVMVAIAAAAAAFDLVGYVERRSDLVTLTGRTQIWDITLQAWHDNVLFGYGPEIWGADRQREFHMFYVGHAHNQVVQTLGEAGVVGLALLLVYLATLVATALRQFVASRGIVLLLFMLMLVRCVTEAPMRSEGVLSWSTFLHALLMVMACHYARLPRTAAANRVPPAERIAPDGILRHRHVMQTR